LKQVSSKLPLYFIENHGQVDPQVRYYVQGRDTSVYFTRQGVTFALAKRDEEEGGARPRPVSWTPDKPAQRWAVKLDFVGANPEAEPVGEERAEAVVSYFKGARDQWKTGLPTYGRVVYRDLWPGIDLVYAGKGGRLKYTFVVQPGARPEQIRLAYRGASQVRVTPGGELEVKTPAGGFRDDKPYAYQEVDSREVEVASAYDLEGDEYGFRLGAYDPRRVLVLDPVVLVYAGFIGGSGGEFGGAGIAVDGSGNAYITGITGSTEATFPETEGPDPTYNGGVLDAFVAKVNAAGTALVYAGYIGGSGDDYGNGIAVDGSGNAYLTGDTTSSEATFPVTVGPDLTYNGNGDAFVANVNAAGTALVYAGYIGGSSSDTGKGIAVDGSGNGYVIGTTGSTQATFPVTVGPDLTHNGGNDAFVVKVNAAGTAPVYAGYIGGSGTDFGSSLGDAPMSPGGIAVDSSGNAYVTGRTFSSEATFPVTVGPDLTYNGNGDAFVAKVNAAGTDLVYAGYIGGSGIDSGTGIAVDGNGNAYVTGFTDTFLGFPVTVGPDLTFNGGFDAFVAKVNAAGTDLVYAGYIGGSSHDIALSIAVDGSGSAYVTGWTDFGATFPVTVGPDLTHNGARDAFVAKVNTAGTALVYAGYLGGTDIDTGTGIALDGSGNAYVAGVTASTEASFPVGFPVTVGPDLTHNGGTLDAFVAKISADNLPPVLSGVPAAPSIPEMAVYTFTATATDPDLPPQTLTFSLVGAPSGATIGPSTGVFTWTPTEAQGPGSYPFTVRVSDGIANTDASITITVTEVNTPPILSGVPVTVSVPATAPYTFTATTTDPDVPVQTLTFSLVGAPSGAAINAATGVFTWTPTGAQSFQNFTFEVRVSDGVANTDASITIRIVGCAPHTVHGHISTVPPSHSGNVSHQHHGQHGHIVQSGCPPHAPGHSAGLSADPDETQAIFSPSLKRVQRGDVVSLYGAAGGLFLDDQDTQPAANFTPPASGRPLYFTTRLPQVRIGGAAATVLFSGLAPGQRGVWQINLVVPALVSPGRTRVAILFEGEQMGASTIHVD